MAQTAQRDYVTVAEAAKELDVSPSTVWRWIDAKKLPAYRVGLRSIRIRRDDLRQVIQPARTVAEPAGHAANRPMTLDEWRNRLPPTEEELQRRRELIEQIVKNREGRSIAPLTTADLIHQVRDEREERHRSWLKSSS